MELATLILFVCGIVLLVGGAELLVRGASGLAASMGISPLVVGLTVVAIGTSAPELAVSVQASVRGQAEIALGNVLGSNIANILLILGLSALVAPLAVSRRLIRFDVPVMLAASVALLLLALDGVISRLDGALLFIGIITYTIALLRGSRRDVDATEVAAGPSTLRWPVQVLMTLAGLFLLVLGSRWLVSGAVQIATALGVSQLVIGLTVVAVGTSLPEIATSVSAALRGEREIAVGNVVGSNIYNLLAVLGISGLASADGIPVIASALRFDLPVMVGVAAISLPILITGYRISRWEGGLLLCYYLAYTALLVATATNHDAAPAFASTLGWAVAATLAAATLLPLWSARRATVPTPGP